MPASLCALPANLHTCLVVALIAPPASCPLMFSRKNCLSNFSQLCKAYNLSKLTPCQMCCIYNVPKTAHWSRYLLLSLAVLELSCSVHCETRSTCFAKEEICVGQKCIKEKEKPYSGPASTDWQWMKMEITTAQWCWPQSLCNIHACFHLHIFPLASLCVCVFFFFSESIRPV